MMKSWIRLSALLLMLTLLVSCQIQPTSPQNNGTLPEGDGADLTPDVEGNEQTPDDGETPLPEEEEKPILLDPAQATLLVQDRATEYVVVLDDQASDETKAMATDFCNRFLAKTGAPIQTIQDTRATLAKEIIVSLMDGRSQTATEYAKLTAPQGKGYRISTVGESIVVACEEEYLADALDLLILAISDCGNGIWGLPKRYVGELDIPTVSGSGSLYKVSEGNYAYNLDNATKSTVNSFLTALEEDGFRIYSTHKVGDSQFATYVKDSIYGQMVVYTMYHAKISKFRLTYGAMEYLPNATPMAAADQADPTITQVYMEMVYGSDKLSLSGSNITSNSNAPGMSYVIQLTDGRFIVIDGGSADGNVRTVTYNETTGKYEVSGEVRTSNDAQRLYNIMNRMKPASHAKPKIATWFISHAHADHWNLARNFLTDYQGKIDLELIAFNFPEKESANILDSRFAAMEALKTVTREVYGGEVWIMHTGQVMELPGARIEVLSTVEDYYCAGGVDSLTKEVDLNNTCCVFRVTVGEKTFMVLGDAYPTTCRFMANAYGSALQSDIMQLSHHGYNGAVLELYQAIDPKICLWPCDEFSFNDSVRKGTENGSYNFNWWLRNKPWKRGSVLSSRTHYAISSQSTTINAITGKVTTSND